MKCSSLIYKYMYNNFKAAVCLKNLKLLCYSELIKLHVVGILRIFSG